MKKRFLSILLCLVMVLTMSPVVSAVGSSTPWTASGKSYATVQAALDDVLQYEPNTTAVTITLSEDYEGDAAIEIAVKAGLSLTIDLNGKELKFIVGNGVSISGAGSVTIKNGSISTEGGSTVLESSANELILEDTTLTGGNNDGNSTLKITGGDVTISGTTKLDSGKSSNTAINLVSGKCTILKGTFEGKITNSDDIADGYFDGDVTCRGTIADGDFLEKVTNNGTIIGGDFYEVTNNGTIEGGNFHNSVENSITGTISGGTFDGSEYIGNSGDISGGTFVVPVINEKNSSISGGTFNKQVTNKASGTITGGTFKDETRNEGIIKGGLFYGGITNTDNGKIDGLTITYMNGESEYAKQVLQSGTTATEPVAPTKIGYTFAGWKYGNTLVTESTTYAELVPDDDAENDTITLKAQWNAVVYVAPTYSVTVSETEHGTVTADRKTAFSGSTVTLTITPEQGRTLETLTVTDRTGREIDLNIVEIGEKYTFKMPGSNVTVTATFMEDNTILNYFVDVPTDSYYYDAVLWAAETGITSGTDDSHFSPDGSCTRAQAVTLLWRAAGSPVVNYAMMMEDVPADAYYTEAVRWALSEGITKGTGDTTFSPDAPCSRGQIVTFLYRSEQRKGNGMSGMWMFRNPFTDVNTEDYYGEAVMWAVANEVTNGTTDTTFSPDDNCTRAQIVTFLYRALGR